MRSLEVVEDVGEDVERLAFVHALLAEESRGEEGEVRAHFGVGDGGKRGRGGGRGVERTVEFGEEGCGEGSARLVESGRQMAEVGEDDRPLVRLKLRLDGDLIHPPERRLMIDGRLVEFPHRLDGLEI